MQTSVVLGLMVVHLMVVHHFSFSLFVRKQSRLQCLSPISLSLSPSIGYFLTLCGHGMWHQTCQRLFVRFTCERALKKNKCNEVRKFLTLSNQFFFPTFFSVLEMNRLLISTFKILSSLCGQHNKTINTCYIQTTEKNKITSQLFNAFFTICRKLCCVFCLSSFIFFISNFSLFITFFLFLFYQKCLFTLLSFHV